MSSFSIRLARPEDASCYERVEEDAAGLLREEASLDGVPIPPSASAEEHARTISYGRSLTALVGGEVVGFAASGPVGRALHLHELSVARIHQGCGIGGTLLRALKVDARNSGFRAVTLSTFRDIPWNAPFYARNGFVEALNLEGTPHLKESLEKAVALGIPRERRIAMIAFLG